MMIPLVSNAALDEYELGDVIAEAHRVGEVLAEGVTEGGMALTARLDEAAAAKLAPWVIG